MTLETPQFSFFTKEEKPQGKTWEYWLKKYWATFGVDDEIKLKDKKFYGLSGVLELTKDGLVQFSGKKHFTIPENRMIMMSPIKYIDSVPSDIFNEDKKGFLEQFKKECEHEMDIINTMNLHIDKENVISNAVRLRSPLFEIYDKIKGWQKAMSEGYWLLLKPNQLSKGEHDIVSFSSCQQGKIRISQEYHITVE